MRATPLSFLLRLATLTGLISTALILLTLGLTRSGPSSGLVFSQYAQPAGRTYVYLDPFSGAELERKQPLHDEAAIQPLDSAPRSPDGTRTVIPRITPDGVDLFVVADAGTEVRLTPANMAPRTAEPPMDRRSNTFPLWSPDGQWITFISADMHAHMDLYIVRPDGAGLRRIYANVSTPMPLGLRWLALPDLPFQPWPALGLLLITGVGLAVLDWATTRRPAG
ncbi:MAG TPA: hypothetical protein VER79_02825 [Candidatus Limnocylindrales bacterium]|nr:hypothetical protein [Candidatus Limnocylindrales bacterium]